MVYVEGICNRCGSKIGIPKEDYDPNPEYQYCYDCLEILDKK